MDKLVIEGGRILKGNVKISGAKNGSLALIPATLLAPGIYHLYNTPTLRDVWTMSQLMNSLGAFCELNDHDLFIDTSNIHNFEAPYELVKKMRASFYVLGPLLARYGYAKVSLPGGCAWGPRPVDLHLKGLERLGAEIEIEEGYVIAKANKLQGARFHFDISSVGATGNVLMAATLAKGTTVLTNAAIEPEITALARFLVKMGAKIDGIGTTTLYVEGVDELKPFNETTIPDRIEAGTYLIAGAMTKGEVEVTNINPYHLSSLLAKLEESGCEIDVNQDKINLKMDDDPKPIDYITAPYPGLPTDLQAQWITYMLSANGTSRVIDTIYPDRFKHVPELQRLGANIKMVDNTAIIEGKSKLKGAPVMSSDLRCSASLVLAGLIAEGKTEVLRIYHLDRGYEHIEKKFASLGASIERVKTEII
ncbi:MAG TPA: UDP-N-acetylglucosamine 1-carboxyvinyltransferase [Candidatus Kapabacteria bacterium]|jgi:UDP-N-acetylglucosamine 1-carboxyvinyltransferase|nr:UDP-N-acetylglucosamine 1-carboxyvinyltransferase [Candidatus Kapabacteria bacterium]HOV91692.1 UDP-N-acetylglucosamine 1-carboxyvinyltransferase [Candidatus Kapabacteria bacterium]